MNNDGVNVPNTTPNVGTDINSGAPNMVNNPVPGVVNSVPTMDNGTAQTVSVPSVNAEAVNNQLNSDIGNMGTNVLNQGVGEIVNSNNVAGTQPDLGATVMDNTLNNVTPTVDNVGVAATLEQPTNGADVNGIGTVNQNTEGVVADTTQVNGNGQVPSSDNTGSVNSSNAVSFGKYLGYIFLFSIPLVGFIMLIVKVFDKKDENISNFAKAMLAYYVILTVISSIFVALASSVIISAVSNFINSNEAKVSDTANNIYDNASNIYDSIIENSDADDTENIEDTENVDDETTTNESDSNEEGSTDNN